LSADTLLPPSPVVIERSLIYNPSFEIYFLAPEQGITRKKKKAFRYTRQEAEAIVAGGGGLTIKRVEYRAVD
jgi:hypothetical protein